MKVVLDKTFAMPASAHTTWGLLSDIEGVAACMPGASVTERIDERHFKGTVAVRFGPANMTFRGSVEVAEIDATSQTLRLVGKGTDSSGSSGAAMDLTARLEAIDAASCNLVGHSEVSMSGKAATFGGRMAGAVADQVLKQFAANFAAKVGEQQAATSLGASSAATAGPAASEPPASSEAPVQPEPIAAPVARASHLDRATAPGSAQPADPAPRTSVDTVSASVSAAPSSTEPQAHRTSSQVGPAAAPPVPLNGLALMWAVIRDWFASLFTAKRR